VPGATFSRSSGSSPRPWGTPTRDNPTIGGRRFIPTPVGNAAQTSAKDSAKTVHPHARGERGMVDVRTDAPGGSSPRPWGTRQERRGLTRPARFIPTPVGNACAERSRMGRHRGSSPRPWGTRCARSGDGHGHRFIPTPVGNAPPRCCCCSWPSVHPHARGERSNSPLMAAVFTVHPHARGERLPPPALCTASAGSSPRPWGTRHQGRARVPGPRFIPTPVGNACPWLVGVRSCTVHPHARGERWPTGLRYDWRDGSSPRPWGTRESSAGPSTPTRFIPTPVGNATPAR